MTRICRAANFFLLLTPLLLFTGCDLITKFTEHEIVIEDNSYLRGVTSGEDYVNLMDNQYWRTYKKVIKEITKISIQYKVTRNSTPADISVDFFFGEKSADTFLGNASLSQGETHADLFTLEMGNAYYQLVDLIMQKDAFWYSIRGNTAAADVDFEPVRISIFGTFNII